MALGTWLGARIACTKVSDPSLGVEVYSRNSLVVVLLHRRLILCRSERGVLPARRMWPDRGHGRGGNRNYIEMSRLTLVAAN